MALPVIQINNSTGSNTLASGAGPATAVSGTAGRSGSTPAIGFFESTPPDLSGVLTDGSHVAYISATSGTRFGAINAVKDTQQTTTGSISSGSAVLTVASSAGMSAGDVISVAGATAGGGILYTTISTVDTGTQVTLTTTAGTTVSGAAVVCPRGIRASGIVAFGSTAALVTWGIGGKRFDFDTTNSNTRRLFDTDAKPGWTIEVEYTGTDYALGATALAVVATGDTTTGRIVCRGTGAQRPKITTATNSVTLLAFSAGDYWDFTGFNFTHTAATRGLAIVATGTSSFHRFYDNVFDGVSAVFTGTSSAASINGVVFANNEIKNCTASTFALGTGVGSSSLVGNYIHGNAGEGVRIQSTAGPCAVVRNIITDNVGAGISHTQTTPGTTIIKNNTVAGNGGGGYTTTATTTAGWHAIADNIFYGNTGYGISFAAATAAHVEARRGLIDHNAFGNNASGPYNVVTAGPNDVALTVDPFTNAAAGDYSLNNTAGGGADLREAGFPGAYPGGLTTTYADIGGSQH